MLCPHTKRTDNQPRFALARGDTRKFLHRFPCHTHKKRFQHQILKRIAGQRQLRRQHKVSARVCCAAIRRTDTLGVRLDCPHGRIQLRDIYG